MGGRSSSPIMGPRDGRRSRGGSSERRSSSSPLHCPYIFGTPPNSSPSPSPSHGHQPFRLSAPPLNIGGDQVPIQPLTVHSGTKPNQMSMISHTSRQEEQVNLGRLRQQTNAK